MTLKYHKPTISLCMIVRNESELLGECLRIASALVDEIIVVDTGSTDGTQEIAAGYGAKVLHHEWKDDFSEARNVSIQHATGDWILWMDADERLRESEIVQIRSSLKDCNAATFLVPILNPTPKGAHFSRGHRLFRNHCGIRFSGRIHEQISPSLTPGMGRVLPAGFTIDHLGYALAEEKLTRKNERNLALLKKSKDADPRDSYVRFTLAQALLTIDDYDAAEKEIYVALGQDPVQRISKPLPPDLRAAAFSNLADCSLRRGDFQTALIHCRESLQIVPLQTTARLIAYRACLASADHEAALLELEEVARILQDPSNPGQSGIEVTIDPADLRHAMGECCIKLNRLDEAVAHFNNALDLDPSRPKTLAALARCAMSTGDAESAGQWLDKALRISPDDESILDFSCLVLIKLGQFEAAAEKLGQLYLRNPKDELLRKRLAGVLVKIGRREEAATIMSGQL